MKARSYSSEPHRRVILLLGAPGSGKGTQSAWLSTQLGIPALSTGDMLRAQAKQETPAGEKLRAILVAGGLVSDEVVCDAVTARLEKGIPRNGIMLDGFPRTLAQARCLDSFLERTGAAPPLVLHLDVPLQKLVDRLTARRQCPECGAIYNLRSKPSSRGLECENEGAKLIQREDDTEAVIRRRMQEFETSCGPVIEYYRRGDYHRIAGDREPHEIAAQLLRVVARVDSPVAA